MVVHGKAKKPSQTVIKENQIYLRKVIGGWDIQREGCTAWSQGDLGMMRAAPKSWRFHPYMQSLVEALIASGSGG